MIPSRQSVQHAAAIFPVYKHCLRRLRKKVTTTRACLHEGRSGHGRQSVLVLQSQAGAAQASPARRAPARRLCESEGACVVDRVATRHARTEATREKRPAARDFRGIHALPHPVHACMRGARAGPGPRRQPDAPLTWSPRLWAPAPASRLGLASRSRSPCTGLGAWWLPLLGQVRVRDRGTGLDGAGHLLRRPILGCLPWPCLAVAACCVRTRTDFEAPKATSNPRMA